MTKEESVLIVDDDEEVTELISWVLQKSGKLTTQVNDPVKALSLLKENHGKFQILLTDFQMPVMNGGELIRSALEHKIAPRTICIVSSMVDESEEINALKRDYPHVMTISKPFSPNKLIEALELNKSKTLEEKLPLIEP